MKIRLISINIIFIIVSGLFSNFLGYEAFAQGFNNNEWVFGYCEGTDNNYISFGKDGIAKVQTIPGDITFGKGNSAMAIDPITGKLINKIIWLIKRRYLMKICIGTKTRSFMNCI